MNGTRTATTGTEIAELLAGLEAVDDPLRLAEPDHHCLLVFRHDEQGAADQHEGDDGQDREHDRVAEHRVIGPAPCCAWGGCAAALAARAGFPAAADRASRPGASMIVVSTRDRISSIVS
jgi:hypothetical protein